MLLFFVIFSINLGSKVSVSLSISINFKFRDSNKTIFAGEINDKAGQIISSPFFNDNDLTARCKAVVQLEVTTQYFNLWYLLIIFSNFFKITLTRNPI